MYLYMGCIHTYISLLSAEGAEMSPDTPVATSILCTQILVSNTILSDKRNQDVLKTWLTIGLGQVMYNMSQEHLVPGNKKCLEKNKTTTKKTPKQKMGVCEKAQEPTKRAPRGQVVTIRATK